MLKKLLIVFASGVILSIVAFGGAWLVGGDEIRRDTAENGWNWNIGDDKHGDDHGPRRTRKFTVEPGARLAMEVPVELNFTRGDKAEMVVSGPARVVDRLTWVNGRLAFDGDLNMRRSLKVTIVAPEITGLDLEAPGNITLRGLKQDRFAFKSDGAVNLEAEGKVRQLFVESEGAGNIDLGKVQGDDATVRMDGIGNVVIAAANLVDVQINGAGNVSLVRKPRTLRSDINGIGSVDHDY